MFQVLAMTSDQVARQRALCSHSHPVSCIGTLQSLLTQFIQFSDAYRVWGPNSQMPHSPVVPSPGLPRP